MDKFEGPLSGPSKGIHIIGGFMFRLVELQAHKPACVAGPHECGFWWAWGDGHML